PDLVSRTGSDTAHRARGTAGVPVRSGGPRPRSNGRSGPDGTLRSSSDRRGPGHRTPTALGGKDVSRPPGQWADVPARSASGAPSVRPCSPAGARSRAAGTPRPAPPARSTPRPPVRPAAGRPLRSVPYLKNSGGGPRGAPRSSSNLPLGSGPPFGSAAPHPAPPAAARSGQVAGVPGVTDDRTPGRPEHRLPS